MTNKSLRLANTLLPDSRLLRPAPGQYNISEIFYSLQGEGALVGTAMVFVRFSECNLRCTRANSGFDCDTDFASARSLTLEGLLNEAARFSADCSWILFTGGEPALQVDSGLISALKSRGWKLAIETNGTIKLPEGLDWITVSPKSAEHTIRQRHADEVKYVRAHGMSLPNPSVKAKHHFISPAFQPDGSIRPDDLEWCVDLVKQGCSVWRLSIQTHKLIGIR